MSSQLVFEFAKPKRQKPHWGSYRADPAKIAACIVGMMAAGWAWERINRDWQWRHEATGQKMSADNASYLWHWDGGTNE